MERIVGKKEKINLNGFNLQRKRNRIFLFCGDEQIISFDESSDAIKICKWVCICKGIIHKKYPNNKK